MVNPAVITLHFLQNSADPGIMENSFSASWKLLLTLIELSDWNLN
jgi:hypothetical protein